MKIGLIGLVITVLFLLSIPLHSYSDTQTPIKHVIIIIDENHSFDNLFGTYPFGYPPIVNNITLSVMEPEGLYTNYTQLKKGTLNYISVPNIPWLPELGNSHPYYADAYSTVDPYEGWSSYHGDYWFDTDDGFVYYSGPQSMAYFSYEQEAPLWDYAEEYVLADNYFAPVMGLTEPNRVAYLTGYPPNFYTDDASGVCSLNSSIFYQLSYYNVSWGYYTYGYSGGIPWPLNAFNGISEYKNHFYGISNFYEDLKGNLPSVSWVMFIGCSNDEYDMHPPYNILKGEKELVNVINAVMQSKYWNSTAIFITFDEGGGYYDQIIPHSINHYGLGQRIPLIIISPYAKEGWINNYTMSGYSILGFIDYNFHLPYITNWSEIGVHGILQSFNFNTNPRQPIILEPNNWTYPIALQYPIHYGYIATVPNYKGYAQVYPVPEMTFLLPLDIVAFTILFISFKKKTLLKPAFLLFIISLGISGYIYEANNIYQFVSEYYFTASFIGFLIGGVMLARAYRRR